MTVKEFINWLEDFDEDTEVVIGMQQRYGSDFAMEIGNISEEKVNLWDEDNENSCIVITEGNQIGSVGYEDDDWDY